jgi:hypothetical protein
MAASSASLSSTFGAYRILRRVNVVRASRRTPRSYSIPSDANADDGDQEHEAAYAETRSAFITVLPLQLERSHTNVGRLDTLLPGRG